MAAQIGNSLTSSKPDVTDPIYFLHIPKTAGSAFRSFIDDHFAVGEVTPWWPIEEHLLKLSREQLLEYKAYVGHYGWYLPALVRIPLRIVTVLRDPVDRTFSHFHDLRTSPQDWLHDVIKSNRWTFEDFVLSDLGKSELTNFMIRHIAFDDIQQDFWGHSPKRDHDLPGLLKKYSDESLLDIALERLESCEVVGLFERFSDSLRLTSHKFGWAPTASFRRHNSTRGSRSGEEVTERAREAIAEMTQLDQHIYDWAKRRFEAELRGLTDEQMESDYVQRMRLLPREKRVNWKFERPINGVGWSQRQWFKSLHPRLKEDVARFACVNGATFVDVPLEQGAAYEVRFFARNLPSSTPHQIQLRVNDVVVPMRTWQSRYDTADDSVWSGIASAEIIARNSAYTRVCFEKTSNLEVSQRQPEGLLSRIKAGMMAQRTGETTTIDEPIASGIEMRWLEIIQVS